MLYRNYSDEAFYEFVHSGNRTRLPHGTIKGIMREGILEDIPR